MRNITLSEMSKVSYLDITNLADRIIPLQACYHENGEWELWVTSNGKLLRLISEGMIDGTYWGKTKSLSSHQKFKFMNIAYKYLSFKDLHTIINGIHNDILNLSCTFSKYDIYFNSNIGKKTILSRIISSELEYIFSTTRSIFDLTQEFISKLRERMINISTNKKITNINKSFSKIVVRNGNIISKEEIILKHKIEDGLAECYERHAHFFLWIKSIRDKILHSPKNFDLIFSGEEGFSVSTREGLFANIEAWNESNTLQPNSLGSIKSLTAYIIIKTIDMLDDFFSYFKSNYRLPPDIAPNYNLFSCSPHIHHFEKLNAYMTTEAWYAKK